MSPFAGLLSCLSWLFRCPEALSSGRSIWGPLQNGCCVLCLRLGVSGLASWPFCHQVRWYHDYRALRNSVRGFGRSCLSRRGRLSGESSELLFSTHRHSLSGLPGLPQFFLCEPKALLVEEQSSVGAGSTLSSVDAGSSAEPGPCWPRLHFLCPTSRCRPCPSPARSPTRGRSPSWSGRARAAGIPRWGTVIVRCSASLRSGWHHGSC